MKKLYIITFFLILFVSTVKAQSIENINVRIDKNKTYITYDLVDVKENQQVDVKIYANVKGMDKPIFKVTGDIGKDVQPGTERIIAWNSSEELTSYNSEDITFKVTVTAKQFYRAVKR